MKSIRVEQWNGLQFSRFKIRSFLTHALCPLLLPSLHRLVDLAPDFSRNIASERKVGL
jgi:hypothetical protein